MKDLFRQNAVALAAETWADLSNALFDPEEGLVAKAYPTRKERERFLQTKEYENIRQLLDAAEERSGLVEGATPQKSASFLFACLAPCTPRWMRRRRAKA